MMQQSPPSPRPLLVPSPTSSKAPPFVVVTEAELAPYTSSIVALPPTVPELIQCWEQQHERCAQMARFMEKVRVEAARFAGPAAAALTAVAAEALDDTTTAAASPPSGAAGSSSGQPSTGSVVARAVVADGKAAGASTATAAAGVVRGTVLTGKVVSATTSTTATAAASATPIRAAVATASPAAAAATAAPTSPAKAAVVAASTTASAGERGPHAAASAPATPSVTAEELQVLRAKALATEATQLLLATTQDDLKACEHSLARSKERLARTENDLAQLRRQVTASESEAAASSQDDAESPTSMFAQLQISLELSETIRSDIKLKYESVLYTLAQLHEKAATTAREKAFLEEKNTHLEGQLQRLLMSSMVTGSPTAAQRGGGRTTAGGGAAQQASSATPAQPPPPQRLSASDSYQKAALEKQIADLQAMTDKLTRDLRKQTARRAKAEETVQALEKEVTDLKASALQFRRQVNESELELERAVSRKEEDERLRQLERDGNRLRTALRERTEHFMREKTEWESQKDALEAKARVQDRATQQLLRRLLACQIREIAMRQCEQAALKRRDAEAAVTTTSPSSPGSTHHTKAAAPIKQASTTAASDSHTQAHHSHPQQVTGPSPDKAPSHNPAHTSADSAFVTSLTSGPVGAAADTATLVNRERQLEELKSTFERRVALVEAQRKAEVQQLQALNKELRSALTASQEELTHKSRLLESAQQQQQQQQPAMAFGRFPGSTASLTPVALSRSSPSFSERRESAAAWVCRTDGDDPMGGPGASVDDLSDAAAGGVFSSAHTPIAASPRLVTEIERRYDPERMSTWEAVQVENEALLDRLTTMQEEKWRLTTHVEDLQRQSGVLKDELRRNASTMNQLLAAGVLTPAAVSKGSAEGSLRALQCLLQETLQEKFALEERLRERGG